MGQPVIFVDKVSKWYRIGKAQAPYRTFRDTLSNAVSGSVAKLKNLFSPNRPKAPAEHSEKFWALKEISFQVNHGEAVGIIGHNGAGKSTLLKILSRITVPSGGKAVMHGRLGSLLEVGTGFHPELTGRENIFMNGSILGMLRKEILQKFDEIVAFAEVEKFLDTPVKHYSSGMHVRLAFSVAAHLEPEILIIDEVLAVGDVRFQKKCLGKMGDVSKSGRTVLFVSHNMSAVRALCQRAILLNKGCVEKEGAVEAVIHKYLSHYQQTDSAIYWPQNTGPGNTALKMLSVEVKNGSGELVSSLNISDEYFIEIIYEAIQDTMYAVFSFDLFTEDGCCAFSSLSNLEKNYYGKPLKKGIYKTRCGLYPNLLNNGKYYITLRGASANWSDPFTMERVIAFECIDDGVLKGDYFGPYGGCVRPALQWTCHKT